MSINLNSIKSETMKPTTINSLPEELLEKIFSNLSEIDLQATACVNRDISRSVIAAANFSEPHSIRNFIQILIQRLHGEIFPGAREQLVRISHNIRFHHFVNLRLLKEDILEVKAKLINILKILDEKTLQNLSENIYPPRFLEDIFELVPIEIERDEGISIYHEARRAAALRSISTVLAQGNIDRAIEVATSIPQKDIRGDGLSYISRALAQEGNIDRAIEVATLIPQKDIRGDGLSDISRVLVKGGNMDRAIEVATLIPQKNRRGCMFSYISRTLAEGGNIDRAIEVATLIPNEDIRGGRLSDISSTLAQGGNIDRAIEVATSISDEAIKEQALSHISQSFVVN